MKEFKNNKELLALVKERNSIQYIDFEFQDIYCPFDIILPSVNLINVGDIETKDIYSEDIDAMGINAWDINAKNINTGDIRAENIDAGNISAGDIRAWNINGWTIYAEDIKAEHIFYDAVCFAYKNIVCKSIEGRHTNCRHFVLNGKLIVDGVEQ